MDFGVSVSTRFDSWKMAKRAEELGFNSIWFYDTQMLAADPFVVMGAAAMATSKIRLATGVLVPSNRIAPVAANCLGTVNGLAPGRVDFGIGTGWSARRAMGLGAQKMIDMKKYIQVVEALLDREMIEWDFEGQPRRIKFLNPELDLINTDDPVPVHISAMGPKTRDLTAELDVHWIDFFTSLEGTLADVADMDRAYRDGGRDSSQYRKTAFTFGCILEDGEDPGGARAKAQAGPVAAVTLHNAMEYSEGLFSEVSDGEPDNVKAYRGIYDGYEPKDARYLSLHKGHVMYVRPEEEHLVDGDLISATTFTATAPELRERLQAMRDAGFTEVTFQITEGQDQSIEDWAELAGSF